MEAERDRQQQLDCADRLRRLDRDRDSDLDSIRVREGEQARRKVVAPRDREAEHWGDRTRDLKGSW